MNEIHEKMSEELHRCFTDYYKLASNIIHYRYLEKGDECNSDEFAEENADWLDRQFRFLDSIERLVKALRVKVIGL